MLRNIWTIYLLKKDSNMKYIIFDLEWNQPINSVRSKLLPHGEIIQIGFIVIDGDKKIIHKDEVMIKPVCYKRMNPYVSTLTGIKQSDINKGGSFSECFDVMAECFDSDTVLITWGDDDMPILRENLAFHGRDDSGLPVHYNLQRIFAAQTKLDQAQIGLKTALEKLGITDEIKAHDALNDAYMTYLIAAKLDLEKGMAEYSKKLAVKPSKTVVQPWEICLPICTANVETNVKPSGIADICRKIHICCPGCGSELSGGELIRQGKCSFLAASYCEDHGEIFMRYELRDGILSVSCFEMTDEFAKIYKNRVRIKEKNARAREAHRAMLSERRKDPNNE